MIRRGKHATHFFVMPNAAVNDDNLSLAATGLLAWLLSKPEDWNVSRAGICKQWRIGKDKAWSLLRELQDAGYIRSEQRRMHDGTMGAYDYVVYDVADPEAAQKDTKPADSPCPAQPSPVKPVSGEADTTKNRRNKEPKGDKEQNCASAKSDPRTEPYSEAFEAFWKQYPADGRKEKRKAYVAWCKLSIAEQDWAVQYMTTYLAGLKQDNWRKPQHATTYINARKGETPEDYGQSKAPRAESPEQELHLARIRAFQKHNGAWPEEWGPMPDELKRHVNRNEAAE